VEDIKSLLGKRIRELRKQKGLSQEELGWKSELHFTYIGGVERGEKNCSIITLEKIAKGLEININDLFDTHSNKIDINKYPGIKKYLYTFYEKLENRLDQGDTPYNLRNCAYLEEFSKEKIIWKIGKLFPSLQIISVVISILWIMRNYLRKSN